MGDDSAFGEYAHLGCSGGVTVGSGVIAGPFVTVHSQEHLYGSPIIPIRLQGTSESGVVIGDNVWIGARVTVLDGSVIGEGSVVAAGSVVRGKFAPDSLIAGIPAKRLRDRKDADTGPIS
jgi:acetyltransferase-like isoleucine patch superfamily enzyme